MQRRILVSVLVVGALLAVAVAGGAWETSDRALPAGGGGDPGAISSFGLTVDGVQIAVFGDLVGMSSGVGAADLDRNTRTLLPAKRAPDSLVLRHGLTSSTELQAWHDLVL